MPTKSKVSISIAGRPNSGKSTVMQLIVDTLKAHNIAVNPMWGIDGQPHVTNQELRLKAVSNKAEVEISQYTLGRTENFESSKDVRVQITNVVGIGYEVTLLVLGAAMRSNFGEYSYSRERAISFANRVANKFEVEVEDTTKSTTEWRTEPPPII